MNHLTKHALAIVGYLFAGLVLAFTSIQTYSLLYETTSSHLIAALGIVLFEVGMIYWWVVFQFEADGLPQMAVSLLVAIFCLILVVFAVAIHLGATATTLLGEGTPARIITGAAIVHLIAKFAYPLLSPEKSEEILHRAAEGRVMSHAFGKFNTNVEEISDRLAAQMSAQYTSALNLRISNRILSASGGSGPKIVDALPLTTPPASADGGPKIVDALPSATPPTYENKNVDIDALRLELAQMKEELASARENFRNHTPTPNGHYAPSANGIASL